MASSQPNGLLRKDPLGLSQSHQGLKVMPSDELEIAARSKLPPATYDYFAGAAETEATLAANLAAFRNWRFAPHVLTGSGAPDPAVSVLGASISLPVLLAPTAMQCLAHPQGEIAVARAAERAGTIYCLSTLATTRLETVVEGAGPGPRWFQLYPCRDKGLRADLVRRAEQSQCQALVLTVDTPVSGRRERDGGAGFRLPGELRYENLTSGRSHTAPTSEGLAADTKALFDARFSFADLEQLVASTRLPVVVKGVLRADDAARAVTLGVAGVIVSNHGGRQLDWAVAALDALPAVVDAVGSSVPVLMDGGVRRGTDVLKAIALGARAVLIGRPYLWALALDGESGVTSLLERLREEIVVAMALLGVASCSQLGPDLLVQAPPTYRSPGSPPDERNP